MLYGYKLVDGTVVIESDKVAKLYEYYLEGLSFKKASEKAGIKKCHASIGMILSDKRYIGNEDYPPLVTKELFNKVQLERKRRAEYLGRNNKKPRVAVQSEVKKDFIIPKFEKKYDDPFKQAEYAYRRIEVKENA
jgi:hypothetical protein